MFIKFFNKTILHAFVCFIFTTVSSAQTFNYTGTTSGSSATSPSDMDFESITLNYTPSTQDLSAQYTLDSRVNSFRLLINDSKVTDIQDLLSTNSRAILYGDFDNNIITAYRNDGSNTTRSYRSSDLIERFEGALTDTGFNINVADINSFLLDNDPNWKGVSFAEVIGLSFNTLRNTEFEYDDIGNITNYQGTEHNWHVTLNRSTNDDTIAVSEPWALLSFLPLLGLFTFIHRRKTI